MNDGIETYTETELFDEARLVSKEVMGCSFAEALRRVRAGELAGSPFSLGIQDIAFMLDV